MSYWYNSDENRLIIANLIAKIWHDSAYKASFIDDPKKILQAAGVNDISEDVKIQVVENTPKRQYLTISADYSPDEWHEIIGFIQHSLALQPEQEIVIVQNTDNFQYIVLPILTNELSLEETQLIQGGAPKIKSVVNSQVLVNKQVLVSVVAAVLAKTKTLIKG
ncbi:nitrile hydratase subunit alpha [Nostoc sp.]|uniref:nitrile hydratase subunit alpha n=1 Tax=Nostoc sp. TaxID=1180 RepID=UPI002FFB5B59